MRFLPGQAKLFLWVFVAFLVAVSCSLLPASNSLGESGLDGTKWHPGHYISVGPTTNTADFLERNSDIVTSDSIQGILKKIYWGTLEPEMGEYDFSEIDRALAALEVNNKHLFLTVWDRSFVDGCNPGLPLPGYIYNRDGGRYWSALSRNRNGCAAASWEPWVTDRFIALMEALGDRYDGMASFQGIASPESALGTVDKYDKSQYKEQFIRLFQATHRAFPHSLVLATLNYLGFDGMGHDANLTDIANVVEELGGGISTPDSIISRDTPFNPLAERFKGRIAIAPMIDTSAVDLKQDNPIALNQFNVERLGASFLFWSPWHRDQDQYLQRTVIPAIQTIVANPTQYPPLVQACPASLQCASAVDSDPQDRDSP
jgi:hypothetical protein